jgi:uncharacterized repeat protein (TIGR01451 family)
MSRRPITLILLALPLVTLCSCKGLPNGGIGVSPAREAKAAAAVNLPAPATKQARRPPHGALPYPVQQAAYYPGTVNPSALQPGTLPPSAWTGGPHDHAHGHSCPHCGGGKLPAFQFSDGPDVEDNRLSWVPDGIKCPWPADEFVCDGGDLNNDVHVKQNWDVVGLDQEDTIAHYDTLDGATEVSRSNCVCIYSPRFAAVRKVTSPIHYEAHERMAGVELPTKLNIHEEQRGAKTAVQPERVIAQLGLDQAQKFRDQTRGIGVDQATTLVLTREGFLPHEEMLFIQRGQFDAHEKARLANSIAAAITWTDNQAVQVVIDGQPAVEGKGLAEPQETIVYELLGKPRLRICKIADKSEAKPGEIVTFTLRFDNVGDQRIGNVTIIDHLTPRLEYVEGSASSTLKADFKPSEQLPGETLVLRWEIADPLAVNEGGVVRFQARVR